MKKLLIGLIITISGATNAESWPKIKFPDKAIVQVVADNMKFHGSEMKTWVVEQKDTQMSVAAFYKKQWKDVSEKFDARMFNGDYIINSLQPPFLFTARIKSNYEGTLTYVGITKANDDIVNKSSSSKRFPQLPETSVLSDIQSNDIYKSGRTLVLANKRSVEANFYFYKDYYKRVGWLETTSILDNSANKAALKLNYGTNYLDLSFERNTKHKQTHIVVTLVNEGRE